MAIQTEEVSKDMIVPKSSDVVMVERPQSGPMEVLRHGGGKGKKDRPKLQMNTAAFNLDQPQQGGVDRAQSWGPGGTSLHPLL